VIGSGSAYYANSNGFLRRLAVSPGVDPLVGTLNQNLGNTGIVNGLALLSGTRVVGGGGPGIGRLFAYDVTAGSADTASDAWSMATQPVGPTSGPSVGSGGVFAQYRSNDQSVLLRVNASTGVLSAQTAALSIGSIPSSFGGNGAPTPVLGAGNKAYVVDDRGSLFALKQDFMSNSNADWGVTLPAPILTSGVVVTASPTIDCNRRSPTSETGVLYIATETGWLVSYLVDSKGLDQSAPWPKYGRDPRNTGNFDGGTVACP